MSSHEKVAAALAEIIRNTLIEEEEIKVPGLGLFKIDHHPCETTPEAGGGLNLSPPRDEVTFVPEQ